MSSKEIGDGPEIRELIGNGPELFRIYFNYTHKSALRGFSDISERRSGEKDWMMKIYVGCPYREMLEKIDEEKLLPKNEQDWEYSKKWTEFPLLESYPVTTDEMNSRYTHIFNKALSHPPATTQEVPAFHEVGYFNPSPNLFQAEETEKLFRIQEKILANRQNHQNNNTEEELDLRTHFFPGFCQIDITHKDRYAQGRLILEKYPENPVYICASRYFECRGKPLNP